MFMLHVLPMSCNYKLIISRGISTHEAVTMSSQNFLFQYGCQAHTQLPSSVQTPRHLTAAHAWANSISNLHFWFSRDLAVGHEFSLHTDKILDKNIKDTDKSFEILITFNLMDTFRHHCNHTDTEYFEDGGNIFFWNTGTHLPEYMECNPKKPKTSKSQTWTFDLRNFDRS